MKIVHFCAGLEGWNGMANTARQFVAEETAAGHESSLTNIPRNVLRGVDRVVIHGAWLPVLWKVAKRAKQVGAELVIRPAGSYDPVRLAYHGWKKRLVGFWERRMLRRADVLLATCEAEEEWIREYVGGIRDQGSGIRVEVTDLKRFFKLDGLTQRHGDTESGEDALCLCDSVLKILYLGRRHPLKGVELLEQAVREINDERRMMNDEWRRVELHLVSDHFGEELERDWAWCDVLCLPTLSENFGRVVAEALERGKRVITTDGAPAWRPPEVAEAKAKGEQWWGRLVYLKEFRDGTDEARVKLLKEAISQFAIHDCGPRV